MSLDNQSLETKQFFKDFIKDKSISELLDQDNKLFSEIKSLENEKHLLVTQNYKKFVSATETINLIRQSLSGFEENLLSLQSRLNNLVSSYEKVSLTVDPLVKKADKQCVIKRDLKRLKYINDLPDELEKVYLEYVKSEEKDVKVFEKVVEDYMKGRFFLEMNKDNQLVCENYKRTSEMIEKVRSVINEYLIQKEFSESELEDLVSTIGLLVKINDNNQSDLIFMYIEKYKLVFSRKFDEVFLIKDDIFSEIDVKTYIKIYNTFEFSINENEFPYFESQIQNEHELKEDFSEKDLDFRLLPSKFFKKGSIIWSIKKLIESGIGLLIEKAFVYYKRLFDEKYISNLSLIFNYILDLYMKKMKERLRKAKENNAFLIDPVFLKEGILMFKQAFTDSVLKTQTGSEKEKIHIELTIDSLENVNKEILYDFERELYIKYEKEVNEQVNLSMSNLINSEEFFPKVILKNKLDFSKERFNSTILNNELDTIKHRLIQLISKYLTFISNLDHQNTLKNTKSKCLLDYFILLFNTFLSCFAGIKRRVYLGLLMTTFLSQQDYVKMLLEPVLKEMRKGEVLKKGKRMEIVKEIDEKIKNEVFELKRILLLRQSESLLFWTKDLFFNVKYKKEVNVSCFRKDVRDFLLNLFVFKKEVDLLFSSSKKESHFQIQSQTQTKKHVPVQLIMDSILIKKLGFDKEEFKKIDSSQGIVDSLIKVYLKDFVELTKGKKLNENLHLQFNFDLFLVKNFLIDWIYVDNLCLHEGFFREIKENMKLNCCSFDCSKCEADSHVLSEVYFSFRGEFLSSVRD